MCWCRYGYSCVLLYVLVLMMMMDVRVVFKVEYALSRLSCFEFIEVVDAWECEGGIYVVVVVCDVDESLF